MSNAATNNKKKKLATQKLSECEEDKEEVVSAVVKQKTLATKAKEKKPPLHSSMEQLQMAGGGANVNVSRRAAGSNWNAQVAKQAPAAATSHGKIVSQPADEENDVPEQLLSADDTGVVAPLSKAARLRQRRKEAQRNKYLAMDCEMVGVGFNGQDDMLARVSIVNKQGHILLDKFVKPRETVTDYRTSISGIRPHDIENGEEFDSVQDEVVALLQGKILIGHGIRNDLAVLHIKHPFVNIRDTSRYKPLCRLVANGRTPSLKRLSQAILGLEIQTGEHNSVEDARATMNIYNRLSADWEQYLQKHQHKSGK